MSDHERSVLRISGADTRPFLQGLVTNDVEKLRDGIVYAALLTAQGKYRADFFLVPDGQDVLLDVATGLAPGLAQALSMYRLRSDVAIEQTELSVSRGRGPAPEGAFADPRDPTLGWRAYDGRPSEQADWDALRVAAGVPESGVELTPDTFILEAGFDRLNGVDFKKGCYVGQEVTARMKHKTELRKGLARVRVEGAAPVGTEITAGGKSVGTLFTQAGGHGLAYLRFDRAGPGMDAGGATVDWDQGSGTTA
ncbi:YgfZ/GcvT domain-containing protein [Ponticoccus alexandrii]|uniref:Folate-binding protein n=1 Tax=Ponticoccus alexandrii TaxID=1943633 RepID=A0ABX7FC03_9RHOB|nr:folate-binding protein YgfZ [Ponticoccus alexandrii]ETA53865.1 aminomethyltransferase [Rhodobacteraceae bacterium PD-2]QRF67238.1 folate-binding protein [Ponticoccus alexandrii]